MSEFQTKPDNAAEKLIQSVFAAREEESDPTIARLRFERRLSTNPRQPRVRTAIKVAAFFTALLVLGGWAASLPVHPLEDGQQIALKLPQDFCTAEYPYWVAVLAKHSNRLSEQGGHSLIVDYVEAGEGEYYLHLGILGVDYTQANEWVRSVLKEVPALADSSYSITQPLVPYRTSVRNMLAFKLLGNTEIVERDVVRAWNAAGDGLSSRSFIYLITRPADAARRVSMVGF